MEMQIPVRQRVPSRHGRENVANWTHECPSSDEYDDHRLYVDILQNDGARRRLAVGKPIVQRDRQLHKPQRIESDSHEHDFTKLRRCNWRGCDDSPRVKSTFTECTTLGRSISTVRSSCRCQLRKHSLHENVGASKRDRITNGRWYEGRQQ